MSLLLLASVMFVAAPGTAQAQLAKGHAKFLGNVYSSAQIPGFANYWNQVTPENAGKWGSAERNRDGMSWTELDAMMTLARANGFPVHFHVLVWGQQQPSWIESLPAAEQLEEIEEWFSAVATRYPDLDWVEVVNEPLHNKPNRAGNGGGNYMEALGGAGTTGWDWVLNAFRMARTHFPNARLMINDFGIVNDVNATNQYVALINLLKAENLVDVIGVQGHAFNTTGSIAIMKSNLDRLAATGLPIQVTELDVDGTSQRIQRDEFKRIFPTFWEHPGVEGITLWGWRPGMWRTDYGATLMNSDGSEKLVMTWLRDYLKTLLADVEPGGPDSPTDFRLASNYPNPFNPSTTLRYSLPSSAPVTLRVFDTLGREVDTISLGVQPAGWSEVTWNADALPTGIYLVRLESGALAVNRNIALVK